MIEFFRDVLNGPLYIVVSIIAIILIMAIIGFIMERKKLEKEHNEEIAHISNQQTETVTPIEPVNIQENNVFDTVNVPFEQPIINQSINNEVEFNQEEAQVVNIPQPEIKTIIEPNQIQELNDEQAVVTIDELVKNQDQA